MKKFIFVINITKCVKLNLPSICDTEEDEDDELDDELFGCEEDELLDWLNPVDFELLEEVLLSLKAGEGALSFSRYPSLDSLSDWERVFFPVIL